MGGGRGEVNNRPRKRAHMLIFEGDGYLLLVKKVVSGGSYVIKGNAYLVEGMGEAHPFPLSLFSLHLRKLKKNERLEITRFRVWKVTC